jgi:hypothetical protein
MSLTKQRIKPAALQLDPIQRQQLTEELLLSISTDDSPSIDAAWLLEVKRRDASFAKNPAAAKLVDDVITRLKNIA